MEFFSREGTRLGERGSLKQQIHDVTNVPYAVLEGIPLSSISVKDRLRWKEGRQTKIKEYEVYSMHGILDVSLPPTYGEGLELAYRRLYDEIEGNKKCTQDLLDRDPRDDKNRIQESKGGLLKASYAWILDHIRFKQWLNNREDRLL